MSKVVMRRNVRICIFALGLLTSIVSVAGHGHGHGHQGGYNGGNRQYHGGGGGYGGGYGHGHGGGYRGDYYNRGGWGWGGPNIVISVPPPQYYVPVCRTVEVCDPYDQCWLEQYCD